MSSEGRYRNADKHIIDSLLTDIENLKRRMARMESATTTTVPFYAKASLGSIDLVPGQIFVGKDHTLNYVYGTVDQVTVYEINGTLFTF